MNAILHEDYPLFELYQALRDQLLAVLTDEDLNFRLSVDSASLAELCLDIGRTQKSYIQSFHAFRLDFHEGLLSHPEEVGVQGLRHWFAKLDSELKEAISGLSDEDLERRLIDRGGGFRVTPKHQLDIYKEALVIFYGKVSVYLKALGKSPGEQWEDWIG